MRPDARPTAQKREFLCRVVSTTITYGADITGVPLFVLHDAVFIFKLFYSTSNCQAVSAQSCQAVIFDKASIKSLKLTASPGNSSSPCAIYLPRSLKYTLVPQLPRFISDQLDFRSGCFDSFVSFRVYLLPDGFASSIELLWRRYERMRSHHTGAFQTGKPTITLPASPLMIQPPDVTAATHGK